LDNRQRSILIHIMLLMYQIKHNKHHGLKFRFGH